MEEADEEFATSLLPVLLERSALLYAIPEFQVDVKRYVRYIANIKETFVTKFDK